MAKVEQRQLGQAAQLGLWEAFEPTKTNMVALYDLAPRFVFYLSGEVEKRRVIQREFTTPGGQRFRLTLKPTRIQQPDGSHKDCYLGEREQIVEEVIRRLASNRSRLTLTSDGSKVRFPFFLNEVRRELERVKHSYRLNEIRDAIVLLNEVRISIEEVDNPRSPLLSAPAFPSMGMRKSDGGGDDRESWVEFNPLVADAIRTLGFQQVSYDLLMDIRDPVTRWLLKRIWMAISANDDPMQQMSASEIRRYSGMPEWKKSRNMLGRVRRAVAALKEKGILDSLDEEEMMVGLRKDDIIFTMTASSWLLAQIRRSRQQAQENLEDFRRISGGREPSEFLVVGGTEFQRMRDQRRRRIPSNSDETMPELSRQKSLAKV